MGIEGELPTPDQVAYIRKEIVKYVEENGQDVFDPRDVQRLLNDKAYVERFFMHMFDLPGLQEDNAVTMVINAFKWRKENQVRDVKAENLNPKLKELGELYVHGRDKDGKVLMVFAVQKHVKGSESMDDLKKFFIYSMERVDRENNGDQLTLVFDCSNCGLKNLDMELIKYMIQVFKDYYPWSLNYILVYEMPWVLNAAWKIIKSWLPAAAVKKIKFLTKANIYEYVAEDQRPEIWGGTDDWIYQWEDEEIIQDIQIPTEPDGFGNGVNITNGYDDNANGRKKSVHFAESKSLQPLETVGAHSNGSISPVLGSYQPSSLGSTPPSGSSPILALNPPEEVVFAMNSQGDLVAKVVVTNISFKSIAYKIKTTSPDKFRVRPSTSSLLPGVSGTIEIQVHSSHLTENTSPGQIMSMLAKDKFLISATTISVEGAGTLSQAQLSEAIKSLRPEVQHRLRCTYSSQTGQHTVAGAGSSLDEAKLMKQVELMTKKINKLTEMQESMASKMAHLQNLLILALFMLSLVLLVAYLWSHPSNTLKLFQENCLVSNGLQTNSLDGSFTTVPKVDL